MQTDNHTWAVGDLAQIEIGTISTFKNAIVVALFDNDEFNVGLVIQDDGRVIRFSSDSENLTFLKTTDLAYQYEDNSQVMADWKAGLFKPYFQQ